MTAVQRAARCLLATLPLALQVMAQERTTAVWKEREIDFLYRSSTAIYECSALRDHVAAILLAVGARGDIQVRVSNCDPFISRHEDARQTWENPTDRYRSNRWDNDPFDTDRMDEQQATVRIRLASPVEVTPEVLAEAKKEKTRRELVARVTGDRTGLEQATGEFPAEWQTVTLSRSSIGLEPEECELLEQMSRSVFRKLGIREVARGMSCNPRQLSNIPPKLTVKALISAPYGGPHPPPETPAPGESDEPQNAPNTSDSPPSSEAAAPAPN